MAAINNFAEAGTQAGAVKYIIINIHYTQYGYWCLLCACIMVSHCPAGPLVHIGQPCPSSISIFKFRQVIKQ